MKPLTTYIAACWLVGLGVAPLIAAEVEPGAQAQTSERLQWLLASHDVRQAIHAPQMGRGVCEEGKAESAQ